MLVPLLLLMSVVMVVEVDNFNRIFDGITVLYTLAAIATIYLYRKKSSSTTEKENDDRTYTFKKKSKIMTWQQKMSATWKKVERTGFYEFMLFNGAPSFIANMNKDADCGQIIEFDPNDENLVKISATGLPSLKGEWTRVYDSEANAVESITKDPKGNKMTVKYWYNAEQDQLENRCFNMVDKVWVYQIRKVNEEGRLTLNVTNTKEADNSSCTYNAIFKK